MSAESPRHGRSGGALTVPPQPPTDRTLIDTVSGFISDVTLASAPAADSRDAIQWARFETADINEPTPEGEREAEVPPLLLVLGYGSGVQVWLVRPNGEAQEVMSWRQGSVRVLRILPTPTGVDGFACKRPLCALCDSGSPGPLYCSLSFISIRGGDQVKSIKFKNPILDVLANKRSVVVSFSERFAVFDAGTLEDRLAVTTCYPCPCPLGSANPVNPLALGDRWLAYADKKLNPGKRSSGGCEGEGVSSYTAAVLHAAKSLGAGLRGLGESVASSLAGTRALSQSPSPPSAEQQPGVVTVRDIEGPSDEDMSGDEPFEPIIAHFVAHSDAIIALRFDASGMLLVTADKRGHRFHVFRMQPHPCGVSLASVHHLYVLHRGDTTAKVQDISISLDCRWTAVSTLRGTTHVFPISPYGGPCGVRTHTQPRVVNRLSRFQRSAGLPIQGATRSSSPVGDGVSQGQWFPNPRLPPYPLPTVVTPLAQIRPTSTAAGIPTHTITRNSSGRQRLSSLSEDGGGVPLLACAQWGAAPPPQPAAAGAHQAPRSPAAQALYVMAATGHLLQYIVHPRHSASVAKEKVCDNTPVELGVELVAQWPLCRPTAAPDLAAPLASNSPLLHTKHHKNYSSASVSEEERWLAQVEIVTHAGPHRRLWMGPQFVFKTYNDTLSGSSSSLLEAEAVEVETTAVVGAARSPPVNISGGRPLVPVLIDSGSASSLEHSPDSFRRKSYILEAGSKPVGDKALGDVQLREDLAEAMRETEQGPHCVAGGRRTAAGVTRAVDPLGTVVAPGADEESSIEDEDPDRYTHANADETLFRPVVRASASLPSHPELSASPLPVDTRIPVENLTQTHPITPDDDAAPLKTEVIIPVALTGFSSDERDTEHECRLERTQGSFSAQLQIIKPQESTSRHETDSEIFDSIDLNADKEDDAEFSVQIQADIYPEENISNEDPSVWDGVHIVKGKSLENDKIKSAKQLLKDTKSSICSFSDISLSELLIQKEENVSSNSDNLETPEDMECVKKLKNYIETDVPLDPNKSKDPETLTQVSSQDVFVPANTEKMFKISRDCSKAKALESQSITPHEKIKADKFEENIVQLDFNPVTKETLPTDMPMCSRKASIRKSKKSGKNMDENKNNIETKQDILEPDLVHCNIRLLSNKSESSINEGSAKDEACQIDDCNKVEKPIVVGINEDNPLKTTEDQIWAMLSDNSNDLIRSKTSDPIKNNDDLKHKSKRSKKSKKIEQGTEQANDSIATEPNMVNIDHYSNKRSDCSTTVKHKNKDSVELIRKDDKVEGLSTDVTNIRGKSQEFYISVETSDPLVCKVPISGFDSVDEQVKPIPQKNMDKETSSSIKAEEARKDSMDSFNLSIDFNTYLNNKNKDKENIAEKTSSKKEDPLQELFNNTVFSLQPSKAKKHTRKNRVKGDEFAAVETIKVKKPAQFVDIMTNFEIKPTFDQFKPHEPDTAVLDSAMDDFPAIGSANITHKDCLQPLSSDACVPVMSYSKVTAARKCSYEEASGMEFRDILEPPKPCRPIIHQKLAEIYKRNDIAVAECDTPDDYDEPLSEFDLPPCEFTLDEFNLEVMRDNVMESEGQIISDAKNVALCNLEDAGKEVKITDEDKTKTGKEYLEVKKDGEHMEKSSDDDNASPATSQTDSDDKEKATVTDSTQLAQKTSSKKKSRQKRRK